MNYDLLELAKQFPNLADLIQEMKNYYDQMLWHQLSESLLKYIKQSEVLANGKHLIEMHDKFVSTFSASIDQIKYIRFANLISEFYDNDQEKIEFLEKIIRQLTDEQAIWIAQLKQGVFKLNVGKWEEVQDLMKTLQKKISECRTVDTLVFSTLYNLKYHYYKFKKIYDELYKSALQFLAYTVQEDLQENEKLELSLEMALAILISPKIFNFSELLEQPILKSLNESKYKWVYSILETYNSGSVLQFEQDMQTYSQEIENYPLLKNNKNTLEEKIRIMAFLDLIFSLPKNDRVVKFDIMQKHTNLQENKLELLIMRAMSLDLVKGTIDQVGKTVKIDWVLPRVLDNKRIQVMKEKIDSWSSTLQELIKIIDTNNQAL